MQNYLDAAQVEQLTAAWLEMFPEMHSFLADDTDTGRRVAEYFDLTPAGFAAHTGNRTFLYHPENAGREHEPHSILGLMCVKVMGRPEPTRRTGVPYTDAETSYFWNRLADRYGDLPRGVRDAVLNGQPSPEVRKSILGHICWGSVFTLTGRLWANATYGARHNVIFQGVAADGAKIALWLLWLAGYRIVNFLHDEVLIEVPESEDLKSHADQIRTLMIAAMEQVVPDVRIKVKYAATRHWHKESEAVFEPKTGALIPWEPSSKRQDGEA